MNGAADCSEYGGQVLLIVDWHILASKQLVA